jgi:hypothetical protein
MEHIQKVELKELKHVETVDKGVPKIEKNVHVKKSARPKVLNEIKEFKGFAEVIVINVPIRLYIITNSTILRKLGKSRI